METWEWLIVSDYMRMILMFNFILSACAGIVCLIIIAVFFDTFLNISLWGNISYIMYSVACTSCVIMVKRIKQWKPENSCRIKISIVMGTSLTMAYTVMLATNSSMHTQLYIILSWMQISLSWITLVGVCGVIVAEKKGGRDKTMLEFMESFKKNNDAFKQFQNAVKNP